MQAAIAESEMAIGSRLWAGNDITRASLVARSAAIGRNSYIGKNLTEGLHATLTIGFYFASVERQSRRNVENFL